MNLEAKRRGRIVTYIVLVLCLSGASVALAQTTSTPSAPAAAPAEGNSYQGTVASVDTTKNTFVINSRTGESTTVATTDKTRITKSTNIGLSGLKVGDEVSVNGQVDTTALTVDARRITVHDGKDAAGRAGAGAGNGRSIRGAVAATSPKLTVTGDDGKTYTILPSGDDIQVMAPAPGTFADIQAGMNVTVHGKSTGTDAVTAKSVEIRPARGGRRRSQAAQ